VLIAVAAVLILLYPLASASPRQATPRRAHVVRPSPLASVSPSPPARPPRPPPFHVQAQVVISAHAAMRRIPVSFLGISTEYWSLPLWERHLSLLDRVFSLVHGPGPLIVRIGGDSADRTFWSPVHELPEWAFELTPAWLREVGTLVRRSGARLILDLNLVTATPVIAARWAEAAEASLPRHSILGFEIGNEPDIYSRSLWQASIADGGAGPVLPEQITAHSYARAFDAYSKALSRAAPAVPLLGPALAEPRLNVDWVSRLLAGPHPGLRAITVHRYPYSACVPRSTSSYPTIARVLSEQATAGMARSVAGAVRAAHRARLPLRLSELNSVTCGGVRGVSNTFATALWAPDALFEFLRAGVSAVSVHVRAAAINAAFALTRRGLTARPLLYGMVMFKRMLGPRARLVSLRLRVDAGLHLKAWAVRSGRGTLRVLLIDKGKRSASVQLVVPAHGRASVERLLAPSVRATHGVTLAGRRIGRNGRWRGRSVLGVIVPGPHAYVLEVSRYSAALVTFHLRAGALTPPRHPHTARR
jgi:hypothetical protein